jgi:hypothetical protein
VSERISDGVSDAVSDRTSDAVSDTDATAENSGVRLRRLEDRLDIVDLFDRFMRDLDERTAAGEAFDVEWVHRFFTDDAHVDYPPGSADGVGAISALVDGRGMSPFRATHHVTTNYVIDLDGDRAAVRCNLLATHVHRDDAVDPGRDLLTVGDIYDSRLVRTPNGWRIAHQGLRVTWTRGAPPAAADR